MRRLLTPLWLLICIVIIACWTLLPIPPAVVDQAYTGGLYRAVAAVLVPLTGSLTTLPVTPLLLAVLLVGVVLRVVLSKHRRYGWRAFGRWLLRLVVTVVTLYALFIVLWGANYGRTAIETRLNLTVIEDPEQLEIISLTESLGNIIRQTATAAPNWETDVAASETSLRRVVQQLEGRPLTLPRYVKRTPPGFLLYSGRATGVMVPWTLEAYVDRALPYPYQLATALHESAHIAGYAGEAEADFITGLAGLTADSPSVRYSVAVSLFERVARLQTPERLGASYAYLPARAKRDFAALRRAYTRYSPPPEITRVQRRFYDTYLRGQGVAAGVADYDRATLLLMAAQQGGLLEFDWEETLLHPPE